MSDPTPPSSSSFAPGWYAYDVDVTDPQRNDRVLHSGRVIAWASHKDTARQMVEEHVRKVWPIGPQGLREEVEVSMMRALMRVGTTQEAANAARLVAPDTVVFTHSLSS